MITPTETEQQMASESSRILERLAAHPNELRLDEDAPRQTLSLPVPAVLALSSILKELAKGNSVTLSPSD